MNYPKLDKTCQERTKKDLIQPLEKIECGRPVIINIKTRPVKEYFLRMQPSKPINNTDERPKANSVPKKFTIQRGGNAKEEKTKNAT